MYNLAALTFDQIETLRRLAVHGDKGTRPCGRGAWFTRDMDGNLTCESNACRALVNRGLARRDDYKFVYITDLGAEALESAPAKLMRAVAESEAATAQRLGKVGY